MNQRVIFITIIILLNVCLSGCKSRNEIDRLAIATAIGIDKAEGGYEVTAQIIIPSEISSRYSQGKSPIVIRTETATTIFEALRKMSREATRRIYVSHIQVLVFGEEVAREGIEKVTELISRDHEFRTDFYILVAKDNTAYSILNTITPIEKISANYIHDSVKVSKAVWGHTRDVQLDELIRILDLNGQSLVLPGIVEIGNRKKGEDVKSLDKTTQSDVLRLQYLAAFKEDKLIGWLDNDDVKGYSYIDGNIEGTIESLDGSIALEIKKAKSKIKAEIVDNTPMINVDIKVEANIGELQHKIDLTKSENISKIEKLAESSIKSACNAVIEKAQNEFKADIFGFGEAIHRGYPKVWKNLKKDWNDEFPDISVNITVNVEIKQTGTILNDVTEKEME